MLNSASAVPLKPHNPSNDAEVQCPPDIEGVSSLTFSPISNFFVATGWNNNAYIWEYDAQLHTQGKAQNVGTQPLLCSAWRADGGAVFLGGCDKTVRLWDLGSNQASAVAQHDAPIQDCFFLQSNNLLATASWDKTIKYWDLRQARPAHSIALNERPYTMDVRDECMVVATADRFIHVFDARTGQAAMESRTSQLRHQIRVIRVFPDKKGYLTGSIEGRVAVTYFTEVPPAKNFTFKCHREDLDVYSVNALSFFPQHGTFLTAGSDGNISFWDKDVQQRLRTFPRAAWVQGASSIFASIPCASVDRSGTVVGYAVSYDWSKGYAAYNPGVMPNYIQLHQCKDEEIKPKPRASTLYRR